jgi:hypothetical protein
MRPLLAAWLLSAALLGAAPAGPKDKERKEPAKPVTYRTTPDGALRGSDGSTLRSLPGQAVREPDGGTSRRLPDGSWRHSDGSVSRTLPDGSIRHSDGTTLRRLPDGSWSGSDGTRIRELPGGQVRVTPPTSGQAIDPAQALIATQPNFAPAKPKEAPKDTPRPGG